MPTTAISLNDIKDRTIELLREVPGVAVQTYGEPRLQKLAQTVFNLVFKQHYWPDLCEWSTVALDGVTGKPTANLTVKEFADIKAIYPQGKQRPLPLFRPSINPDTITGSSPRYVDPLRQPEPSSATKLFRVLPITATGSVTFYARYHPGDLTGSPEAESIHLDLDLLAFGCAYMSLEQDASNPGATQMYQGLFENRMTTLRSMYGDIGVPFTNEVDDYPTEWYVA